MRLTTVLLGLMMLAGCAAVQDSPPGWGNNQRVELYTRLGLGYMEQNRLSASLEALEQALAIAPQDSAANHAMALLRFKLSEPAEARRRFRISLASDPGNFGARNDFGTVLCELGAWADGIQQFRQALDDPFNTAAYRSQFGLGVCLMGVSDLIGAQDQFRAALVSRPNSGAILYQCAVVSFNLGENLSTRAFLERYFGTGPASADSLLLGVRNEQKLGAKDLVAQYASKLRSDYPTSDQVKELRAIMVVGSND